MIGFVEVLSCVAHLDIRQLSSNPRFLLLMFPTSSFIPRIRIRIKIRFPLWNQNSIFLNLLMLHNRTLLRLWHHLFRILLRSPSSSSSSINHIILLHINPFNIKLNRTILLSIASLLLLFVWGSCSLSISMVSLWSLTVSCRCWTKFIKISIVVLVQHWALASTSIWLGFLLLTWPEILLSIIPRFFHHFLFLSSRRLLRNICRGSVSRTNLI